MKRSQALSLECCMFGVSVECYIDAGVFCLFLRLFYFARNNNLSHDISSISSLNHSQSFPVSLTVTHSHNASPPHFQNIDSAFQNLLPTPACYLAQFKIKDTIEKAIKGWCLCDAAGRGGDAAAQSAEDVMRCDIANTDCLRDMWKNTRVRALCSQRAFLRKFGRTTSITANSIPVTTTNSMPSCPARLSVGAYSEEGPRFLKQRDFQSRT